MFLWLNFRDHHHYNNNGAHSSSFSRVPVALHRYLPFYSHFAAARHHRKSKSMGHLNQEFVVNDPLFGPISIIGRQLTPTKSEEDEGSTRMMTFDADDEDYVDNFNDNRNKAQEAAKRLRRQQRIKTSFSVDDDEMGVVRDVIADDDDYEVEHNNIDNMIRMIRLSEDHGSRQVSLIEEKAVGKSRDFELSLATTPSVEVKPHREIKRARSTKKCDKCNYNTTSKRKLVRHLSKSHPLVEEEFLESSQGALLFRCRLCEYATSKERRLKRHHRLFHTEGGKIEEEEPTMSIKQ